MKQKHFFIEHKNNAGDLYIWGAKYDSQTAPIMPELFYHQLERLVHFEERDFQFVSAIAHPIHGDFIKIIVSENIAGQFYADLPNKRRSVQFKGMSVRFLLIDVYNEGEYRYKIKHYSNALIYLLEHYKSTHTKQEFENIQWGLDGTVN